MSLEQFKLLSLRSAGPDGAAHLALASDGTRVELRVLGGAHSDPRRWTFLSRRLRLAALLDHPGALRLRELGLNQDPPYLVIDQVPGKNLADKLGPRPELSQTDAVALLRPLAEVLAAAHHLGLAHGKLCPATIFLGDGPGTLVDFTGTRIGAASTELPELNDTCRAPEIAPADVLDPAHDLYALGVICLWLASGEIYRPGHIPQGLKVSYQDSATAITSVLETLGRELVKPDPADRPGAAEIADRLRELGLLTSSTAEQPAATSPANRKTANLQATLSQPVDGLAVAATHILEAAPSESATALLDDELVHRGRLGRFLIRRKLGQGGMGAVYEARDPVDNREVAIKVLRQDWALRPAAVQRFRKEARLLAEVNNPFVANLFEMNEDEGVYFIALELVRGETLDHYLLMRGRLEEANALRIMADVARALVDAHERGIVHRDVKPDNVMLVAEAPAEEADSASKTLSQEASGPAAQRADPRVKLMDFGLARHVVESESLNVTQAGAILGTPLYMAPEQCSGNSQIDARADVYAMGATLFHLLAGRPPFVGDTPIAVISSHLHDTPPSLKSLVATVSDPVSHVIE